MPGHSRWPKRTSAANDRPLGAQIGVANPPTAVITSPSFPATTYPTARSAMAAASRAGRALMMDAISLHRSTAQDFSFWEGRRAGRHAGRMAGGGEAQIAVLCALAGL